MEFVECGHHAVMVLPRRGAGRTLGGGDHGSDVECLLCAEGGVIGGMLDQVARGAADFESLLKVFGGDVGRPCG